MKRSAFLAFVLWICLGALCASQTKPQAAPVGASLDLLVQRVDGYWKALSGGNRARAAAYIAASDRRKFSRGVTQQFRDPKLKSLELSDNRTEAIVTVMVKRMVPPVTIEMDWPIAERWKFESGNWYRKYDPQQLPIPGLARPTALTPAQLEAARQEMRNRLQFETASFDFGTVNKGNDVVLSLKYRLAGTDPVPFAFSTSAQGSACPECDRERGIAVRGLKQNILSPGEQQEILIEVPTWNYDGAVKEQFTLTAIAPQIEVRYEFSVKGEVYVPLSISPKVLRIKKGEREREIILRNNSKEEIQLQQVISETHAISLNPFPVSIPPGEELNVKVEIGEAIDSAFPNSIDRLAITYTPVDGFSSLSYRVYLNAREEKQKAVSPPSNQEIQEMIRKNQILLPRR